jgi:hypothetical protein
MSPFDDDLHLIARTDAELVPYFGRQGDCVSAR